MQSHLFHDLAFLNNIDRDIVVNIPQNIQIQHVDIALHLYDILFLHLVAAGIFYDGDRTVQLIQLQVSVNLHALAGLDMVQHQPLLDLSYI